MVSDEIRDLAQSYSGLQYVVTDPTKQWPWGSVPAVNEIVDLVRATPELLDRIAALEAEVKRLAPIETAAAELTALSPCFITIRPGGDDIECCQFCGTDNGHHSTCEWVALAAALAASSEGRSGDGAAGEG